MTILLVIMAALFVIGIVVMIVLVIRKDTLRAALASFVGSLVGVIASQHAPELSGDASVNLTFGSLGSISGHLIRMNTAKPLSLWIATYACLGILILYTLHRIPSKQ
jgi:hypothetical protein